jgi:hypothetical protein
MTLAGAECPVLVLLMVPIQLQLLCTAHGRKDTAETKVVVICVRRMETEDRQFTSDG